MRLGQLARKLEVRPNQIVEFLATQNVELTSGTNTRISPEQLDMVVRFFSPGKLIEDSSEEVEERMPENNPENSEVINAELTSDSLRDSVVEEYPVEKEDVIKAPKIELSGLKVLGKIELPEKFKKGLDQAAENLEPQKEARKERRPRELKRTTGKNTIALQREQEAREAKKKREEENRLQKERRTQNYLKKVKSQQPTKAARIFKEDTLEMSASELQEPPKSIWGKFVKWLTR